MRLLLASRNPGKLVELQRMLSAAGGVTVVGLNDVPEILAFQNLVFSTPSLATR